ncbi:hemerythrin domain-containing protein [Jiella sp. MQZ9-1]|uniref:Hemerythrin domain-containing protein n=1 Tax=Jiella flava TaxID=2816857 RepID=A0A939FT76_9HYPH|nr:hemerythrin domain-containing protein [Jiella flava]MBO0661493.1 hemerythrin domain-containing protein [Jiella flava]MCD2470135.1 hemerythrin domain-containing protein [Jiella flava]
MDVTFDLDLRPGLPDDLKLLLDKYPRESWEGHANLEGTARFWLSRHDMFRELGAALTAALHQEREGEVAIEPFRQWFVPRLGFFLNELNGHHRIEDAHYFPAYQAAEPKLARGFELLDADHSVIHHDLESTAATANAFLQASATGEGGSDGVRRARDAYSEASERLLMRLMRHLEDEEDLIIPLILDRGDAAF